MRSTIITSLLSAGIVTASLSPLPEKPSHVAEDAEKPFTNNDVDQLVFPNGPTPFEVEMEEKPFYWSDITPSTKLVYHPCFSKFQCARLEVPMNWNATSEDTPKVALAVIKYPAQVPVTDPRYAGPIFLNPGGPGGSGVSMALKYSPYIQTIADAAYLNGSKSYVSTDISSGGLFYDILSWDPRSVNNTTPFHACFSDPLELAHYSDVTHPLPGSPEFNLNEEWARHMALAQGCLADEALNPRNGSIADFMTTETVVRDMVEILERTGEWREAEVMDEIVEQDLITKLGGVEVRNLLKARKWKQGEEKLSYWGFSYGTILGATFATLQPHRAHRVILDGVADSIDYYHGGWTTNLQDTDKIMDNFFSYCYAAGPENCSMALEDDESAEDIASRFSAVMQYILTEGPIPVPGNGKRGPQVITISDIYDVVFAQVYKPQHGFETLSDLISPIANSLNTTNINATAFAESKHTQQLSNVKLIEKLTATGRCNLTTPIDIHNPDCAALFRGIGGRTSFLSIACRDGDPEMGFNSKDEYEAYHQALLKQSKWLGSSWPVIRFGCSGWPNRPADGNGHWWPNRAIPLEAQFGSNATAHPVLFMGNSYDPVTPVRNAHRMSAMFQDSAVLQLDIDGHCTLSGASLGTAKAIRAYFQTGELVESGTVMKPNFRPLVGAKGEGVEVLDQEKLSLEELKLFQASEDCAGIKHRP